jgi:hypothetical protein
MCLDHQYKQLRLLTEKDNSSLPHLYYVIVINGIFIQKMYFLYEKISNYV